MVVIGKARCLEIFKYSDPLMKSNKEEKTLACLEACVARHKVRGGDFFFFEVEEGAVLVSGRLYV